MDAAMLEAGLIRQIQSHRDSNELAAWKREALERGAAAGLDDAARERVNREYKAQLAALMQIELAGG